MFSLAAGKTSTGRALNNPVLIAEGRVTTVDGLLDDQFQGVARRVALRSG